MKIKKMRRRDFISGLGKTTFAVPTIFSLYGLMPTTALAAPMDPRSLPVFPTSILNRVKNAKFTYHDWPIGGAHAIWNAGTINPLIMALNSYSGLTDTDNRLVEQINYWTEGNRTPIAQGGYSAQHDLGYLATALVAKNTKRIWDRLSTATKNRIDLVAKAELISNCFVMSDKNPYILSKTAERTVTGDTLVARSWAPNYQVGMQGCPLISANIIGGPAAAQNFLNSVRLNDFLSQLRSAGLSNIVATFSTRRKSNAPSFAQIETAIRNWTYTYRSVRYNFSNTSPWTVSLIKRVYDETVSAGLNGGVGEYVTTTKSYRGKIMTGASGLNIGAKGMLSELNAKDASGLRSAMAYSSKGMRGSLMILSSLMVAGAIDKNAEGMRDVKSRMIVGISDFKYKTEKGYLSYSNGGPAKTHKMNETWIISDPKLVTDYNYNVVISLWDDFVSKIL